MAGHGAPIGNNYASKAKKFRVAIDAVLHDIDATGRPGQTMYEILLAYIADAKTDKDVRKDFLDRMFGKPAQAIIGDDENPLTLVQRVQREIVRARPENTDG